MMSCLSYLLAGVLLGVAVLFGSGASPTGQGQPPSSVTPESASAFSVCLPAGRKLTDVVSASAGGANTITVEQALNALGAHCTPDNKLVDGSGKEIRFYQLTGCWGNPPENYQEILKNQADAIAQLKQQFTVIEMTCNPKGLRIS